MHAIMILGVRFLIKLVENKITIKSLENAMNKVEMDRKRSFIVETNL